MIKRAKSAVKSPEKAPERKLPPLKKGLPKKALPSRNRALVEAALSAIEDLYADTTVAQWQTADALREIADDIQIKIEALEYGR